jgi:hypothetical protein
VLAANAERGFASVELPDLGLISSVRVEAALRHFFNGV